MRVILATIPSTGTNFFKAILERNGIKVRAVHLTDNGMDVVREEIKKGSILVTTYRDIENVEESWRNRPRADDLGDYLCNWYKLEQYSPVVLSVDYQKEERLALLSMLLDVDFGEIDWTPPPSRWKQNKTED